MVKPPLISAEVLAPEESQELGMTTVVLSASPNTCELFRLLASRNVIGNINTSRADCVQLWPIQLDM
jgi:hypothetical protein